MFYPQLLSSSLKSSQCWLRRYLEESVSASQTQMVKVSPEDTADLEVCRIPQPVTELSRYCQVNRQTLALPCQGQWHHHIGGVKSEHNGECHWP